MQWGGAAEEERGSWVLDLSRRGLRAIPSDAVRAPVGAVAVHLEGNELTAASCVDVAAFSDARRIHLDENDLGSLPAALGRLCHLEVLTAARSRLVAVAPGLPAPLPALRTLSLAENRLEGHAIGPDTWASLPALEALTLAGNALTGVPGVARCRRLRVLCLDRNRLTTLPDDVGTLQWLEHLRVDCNRLEALPASLARCTRLAVLGASRNALCDLHGIDFARLPHIRAVHLAGNALSEVPASLRAAGSSLRVLDLSHNAVAALPPWLAGAAAREAHMSLLGAFAAHGNPCEARGSGGRTATSRAQPQSVPRTARDAATDGARAASDTDPPAERGGERSAAHAHEEYVSSAEGGAAVATDLDATLATLGMIKRGLETLDRAPSAHKTRVE